MLPWIQNNWGSIEAFNPGFKIRFNSLIFSTSLNKVLQQVCL